MTELGLQRQVDTSEDELCYSPIESIEQLFGYGVSQTDPLSLHDDLPPKCTLLAHTQKLSNNFSDVKIQLNGRRFLENNCPRTLVCHDFKGGYLDDRFVLGTTNPENYVFRHWLQTDIFCYFSHKFVTIPPLGWINAAHKHGVQCIGTIITESTEGKSLCQSLLQNVQSIEKGVKKLCLIAKHYKFDGYLVNIENKLENPDAMLQFLRLLTAEMKTIQPNSLVIWYDSVTIHGELKWQDELNSLNKAFFDACDGIYLNYGWDDEKLSRSVEEAGQRKFDVFVGVDVFGRGCYGGGGLETYRAVEKVAEKRLSIAVFAPGWTFECHAPKDFLSVDDKMWQRCANFLYYRTLTAEVQDVEPSSNRQNTFYKVFMSTDFNLGFGETNYYFGRLLESETSFCADSGPWFNLSEQSYQPVINCFRESSNNGERPQGTFDASIGFLGGGSLRVFSPVPQENQLTGDPVCPVWIPLNIPVRAAAQLPSKCALVAMVAWKKEGSPGLNDINPITIFAEVMKPSVSARKIIRLSHGTEQIAFERPENPITIKFQDFIPSKYAHSKTTVPQLSFVFKDQDAPVAQAEVNSWKISCFLVDLSHCMDWNITSLKLGSSENIFLGLLSLAMLSY